MASARIFGLSFEPRTIYCAVIHLSCTYIEIISTEDGNMSSFASLVKLPYSSCTYSSLIAGTKLWKKGDLGTHSATSPVIAIELPAVTAPHTYLHSIHCSV